MLHVVEYNKGIVFYNIAIFGSETRMTLLRRNSVSLSLMSEVDESRCFRVTVTFTALRFGHTISIIRQRILRIIQHLTKK